MNLTDSRRKSGRRSSFLKRLFKRPGCSKSPTSQQLDSHTFPNQLTWTDLRDAILADDVSTVDKFLILHGKWTYTQSLVCVWCDTCGEVNLPIELCAHVGSFRVFNLLLTSPLLRSAIPLLNMRYAVNAESFGHYMYRLMNIACCHGNADIARALIAHGKNTWIQQHRNLVQTVLVSCMVHGHFQLAREVRLVVFRHGFCPNIVELAYLEGVDSGDLKNGFEMTDDEIRQKLSEFDCPQPHQVIFLNQELDQLESKWWAAVDTHEQNAIELAVTQGKLDVVRRLISILEETKFVLKLTNCGLYACCRYGRDEILNFLLDHKWRSSERDLMAVFRHAAEMALEHRYFKMAEVLLDRAILESQYFQSISSVTFGRHCPFTDGHLFKIAQYSNPEFLERMRKKMNHTFFGRMLDLRGVEHHAAEYIMERKKDKFNFTGRDLNTIVRGAGRMSLVLFEKLVTFLHANVNVMIRFLKELFERIGLGTNVHPFMLARVTPYLMKSQILLTFCNKNELFVDQLYALLRQCFDFRNFDILFDFHDFSEILIANDRKCFLYSPPPELHVSFLLSMCGWTWNTAFSWHLLMSSPFPPGCMADIDRKIALRTWTCMREAGMIPPPIHDDGDDHDHEIAMIRNPDVMSLKSVSRIALRRHLRCVWKSRSMAEMILTLYCEGHLPRSLVDFLLFRSWDFDDTPSSQNL